MNPAGLLNRFSLSFSEFWAARDARERAMLAAAALAVSYTHLTLPTNREV